MADKENDIPVDLDDIESVRKALDEERDNAEKYLASWQRAEADLSNYKRRTDQERADLASYANTELIKDLLPVVDDLERALSSVPCGQEEASWVDGVRLVYRKLLGVLESRGVTQIACEGEDFDPNVHEAVMCVDGEEGKVVEEMQKGYKLRDRVIRPSMCKVGSNSENPETP